MAAVFHRGLCGNDDEGTDVGDVTMVEVVDSSSACPQDRHDWFVVVKSKLRWRGLVAYDDGHRVVRSVIFCGTNHA
jgi:hypothetical protein